MQHALEDALSTNCSDGLVLVYVIDYSEFMFNPNRDGRGGLVGWYQNAIEDPDGLFAETTERTDKHDADLTVIGSYGRTGVARVLLRSVAEQVVRRSDCPTMVVH
ncbi:universal stress protein [Halorubrum sp. N11]|uniref:universal stress protein n=1 Tax=Halorubrum sp. N11 TaxID=3402276 RepID=UPI003EBB2E58